MPQDMTTLSPKVRANRLRKSFDRDGGASEASRRFETFPQTLQAQMLERADLLPGELPVLAYFRSASHWTLLTSARAIIQTEAGTHALAWEALTAASTQFGARAPVRTHRPQDLQIPRTLTLWTLEGSTVEVDLEPGLPLRAMANAVNEMAQLNRKASR